ncbi:MAG: hypothetical protein IID18_06560 [Nitrospinae bacterium]|nr:hypothetical protein [Nitrospinota bacterium]
MHEVRIYDGSGNLKKVVSVKNLNKRSDLQINSPSLFKKNRKTGAHKPAAEKVKN